MVTTKYKKSKIFYFLSFFKQFVFSFKGFDELDRSKRPRKNEVAIQNIRMTSNEKEN